MAQAASKDTWSAHAYNANAAFVYSQAYTNPVLSMLNPQPGDKIYDFGCGSGELSVQIAKAVGKTGVVVGVDASESMVREASFVTIARKHIHRLNVAFRSTRRATMASHTHSYQIYRRYRFQTLFLPIFGLASTLYFQTQPCIGANATQRA